MLISILLPTYNCVKYVSSAIDSMLRQTHKNLEIVVIDNCSTDGTWDVIKSFNDKRLLAIQNPKIGLVGSLNRGMQVSRGAILARMDADDVSKEDRIEKQYKYLLHHRSCVCVGTSFSILGSKKIVSMPVDDAAIRVRLWEGSPICSPTAMIRRQALARYGYDEKYRHAEDYKLWSDLSEIGELHNIPEDLLSYRMHSGQVSKLHQKEQSENSNRIKILQLSRLVSYATAEECKFHVAYMKRHPGLDRKKLIEWSTRLILANRSKATMPEPEFTQFLISRAIECTGFENTMRLGDLIRRRIGSKARKVLKLPGAVWS